MDLQGLPEADKHILYGLLLKKKRSHAQEQKVLSIVRSALPVGDKIQAIVNLTRVKVQGFDGATAAGVGARRSATPPAGRRRAPALVVDARPEVTRLLKKCALRRDFTFSRAAERYDALSLLMQTRARLVVVNETLGQEEEYVRYFEICRAIVPGVRIVYLWTAQTRVTGTPLFSGCTRFLSKPLSIERLEESVRELLPQTYSAERSR